MGWWPLMKLIAYLTSALLLSATMLADEPAVRVAPPQLQGSRPLEQQTESAVIRNYLESWKSLQEALDQNQAGKYSLTCFGRSCDGATLELTIAQPKPVDFLLIGSRGTLPVSAAPLLAARPRFSEPQYNRDESIAFTRIRL